MRDKRRYDDIIKDLGLNKDIASFSIESVFRIILNNKDIISIVEDHIEDFQGAMHEKNIEWCTFHS